MREIKFRAWNNFSKLMLLFKKPIWEWNREDRENISGGSYELMQYTELKDKNGIEIYEGDIVKETRYISNNIVRFGKYKRQEQSNHDRPQDNYGFYLEGISYSDKHDIVYNFGNKSIFFDNVEVIGNIYENPELLKEENQYGKTKKK